MNDDIVSHTSSINPICYVHEYPSRDVIALHTNSALDSTRQAYENRITSLASNLMPLGENIGNTSIDYVSKSDICESDILVNRTEPVESVDKLWSEFNASVLQN